MAPPMPKTVTITTPGPATTDPETGNPRPGPPTVQTVKAWLSHRQIAHVGVQIEIRAAQETTISLWTVLVPAGTVLESSSIVEENGARYEVIGDPADRPDHRPIFRAAALRKISDLQS